MASATAAFASSATPSADAVSASEAAWLRSWVPLSPPASPGARTDAAMAFDPAINKMVLFGGYGGKYPNFGLLSDTWTYDGTTWTQQSPATSPPAQNGTMVYDPALGKIVLFTSTNPSSA